MPTTAEALRYYQGDIANASEFDQYWSMFGDPPDDRNWWLTGQDELTPQAQQWFSVAKQAGDVERDRQAAADKDDFGFLGPVLAIASVIPGPWQIPAMALGGVNALANDNLVGAILSFAGAAGGLGGLGGAGSAAGTAGNVASTAGGGMNWLTSIGDAISGLFSGSGAGGMTLGDASLGGLVDTGGSLLSGVSGVTGAEGDWWSGVGSGTGEWGGATGGGGGLLSTIGKALTGGLGGGNNLLPAILGGLLGSQTKVDPTTQSSLPWNAGMWAAPQNRALELMNSQLNLPEVPNLPVAGDQFLQQAIAAAIDPTVRDFQTRIMPGIRTDFNDQYGSTKHQLATGRAAEGLARTTQNTGAQMAQAFYPFMFNTQREAVTWPYEQRAGQAQALFEAPFAALRGTSNTLAQASGGGRTTTTEYPQTPWWQGAAGGALAGANLWDIINRTPVRT